MSRTLFVNGFKHLTTLLAFALVGEISVAQTYPNKPIHLVVPYAAGSTTDLQGRMIAEVLTEALKQPVVVENRIGASGTIGSERVSRAQPDGYTLVLGSAASHLAPMILMAKPPYDSLKDFSPISLITKYPNAIVVAKSLNVPDMNGLVQYIRTHPGMPYGTAGPTTAGRFTAELMQSLLKIKMTMVPYNGAAAAVTDLMGGHLQLAIVDISAVAQQLSTGKFDVLSVTSKSRSPILPNIPTLEETGVSDFESVAWVALFAPPGTPEAIRLLLSDTIRKGLRQPALKTKIELTGGILVTTSPTELHSYLATELTTWRKRAQENGIQVE